jgi:hypothetical protein
LVDQGQASNAAHNKIQNQQIQTLLWNYSSLCASIWEDLQQATVATTRVDDAHLNPKHFLMALHRLKQFPTDNEQVGMSISCYSKSD